MNRCYDPHLASDARSDPSYRNNFVCFYSWKMPSVATCQMPLLASKYVNGIQIWP